jgi:hypothetical protein
LACEPKRDETTMIPGVGWRMGSFIRRMYTVGPMLYYYRLFNRNVK